MKRTIIYSTLCLAMLASCSKQAPEGTSTATSEVSFNIGTRVGPGGVQADGDTYSILCYGSTSTILPTNSDWWGYYGYDAAKPTSLQPLTTGRGTYPYSAFSGSRDGGLRLNQGTYNVVVMYPAVPVNNPGFTTLGSMAVFKRTEDIYASDVNDYAATGSSGQFQIKVLADMNFHIFDFPTASGPLTMKPITSAIDVYFYSSEDLVFTIAGARLMNAGVFGWYNPAKQLTYPSYSASNSTFSFDNTGAAGDVITLKTAGFAPPIVLAGTTRYWLDTERVFPADYRGPLVPTTDPNYDANSVAYVKPLALRVPITMNGASITSDIPLKVKIERRKKYTFYIDITSEMFSIKYTVADWDVKNGTDPSAPIGEVFTYGSFTLSPNGTWTEVTNPNGNIGN